MKNPNKEALGGGSWGDVATLMRLVPLMALDQLTIARRLQPVLVLTAPEPELREDPARR